MPYDAGRMRPAMRGALLAPWPNRTAGGRYEFLGIVHQLPVNELELQNAAHGLIAWHDFTVVSKGESHVRLTGTIEAQPGFPWRVRVDVLFDLDVEGLKQRVVATNEASEPAPFGAGGHPYLTAGPALPCAADGWFLELPADEVMQVSPDRLLPVGIQSVQAQGGTLDFRERRLIGEAALNHAFGALRRDADGLTRVRVTDQEGLGVELACDESSRWIQVYTADAGDPADRRHAVAVEPMTCPPDALNSKIDLITLAPGATYSMEWRIRRIRGVDPAHEEHR